MSKSIYFDHNATTPLSEIALETMLPFMREHYGNPSSIHQQGRVVKKAIQKAREQIADCINAEPDWVHFTSGGTEANNWALRSQDWQDNDVLMHSAVEHEAIVQTAVGLISDLKKDILIKTLFTNTNANIDIESLSEYSNIRHSTSLSNERLKLVSVMMANNEVGSIFDIKSISAWAKGQGAVMHSDAVQALGKMPIDFKALGVDFMSLSAHKIGGPKGIGALIAKPGILKPWLYGGGQEFGLRSGTENVPAIVGFGAVCAELTNNLDSKLIHLSSLQSVLETGLSLLPVKIIGADTKRLCNTTLFTIKDKLAENIVLQLDKVGFCVSSGSACSSSKGEPSHVIRAIQLEPEYQNGVIRISFGTENTITEVNEFLKVIETLIV